MDRRYDASNHFVRSEGIFGPETNFKEELVLGATGGALIRIEESGLACALLEFAAYPKLPTAGGVPWHMEADVGR
jgi:hypothetical protein